MAQQHEDKL